MLSEREELAFLIMQFLDEQKFTKTLTKFGQESGFYFNINYVEEEVLKGNWDEVEKYLSAFIHVDDDVHSRNIFFDIHIVKYLEALDKPDKKEAFEILMKDLMMVGYASEKLFNDLAQLLILNDFREHDAFAAHKDTKSTRTDLLVSLKRAIEGHPILRGKLQFPTQMMTSRLCTLVKQRFQKACSFKNLITTRKKFQHSSMFILRQNRNCKHPWANEIETLFVDHTCKQLNGAQNGDVSGIVDEIFSRIADKLTGELEISTQNREPTCCCSLRVMGSSGCRNGRVSGIFDASFPRIADKLTGELEISTQNSEPTRCFSLRIMGNSGCRISRLIYAHSGCSLVALASNGVHLVWQWGRNKHDLSSKATARISPKLLIPTNGKVMCNDCSSIYLEDVVHFFALTNNDRYIVSASGGTISLFDTRTFKTLRTFMPPPPAATCVAFHPKDNNILAIGMEDSTIQIYHITGGTLIAKQRGHSEKITGLAYSNLQDVILISADANAQICVWSTIVQAEPLKSILLPMPQGWVNSGNSNAKVEFHPDQIQILVVHKSQIAIYLATELKCITQRMLSSGSRTTITDATFSCDGQIVYASFSNASVCIFNTSNLTIRCWILPTAYLPSDAFGYSENVHPIVIAAHPSEPNQFALGLTDGHVHVLEPAESGGAWPIAACGTGPIIIK